MMASSEVRRREFSPATVAGAEAEALGDDKDDIESQGLLSGSKSVPHRLGKCRDDEDDMLGLAKKLSRTARASAATDRAELLRVARQVSSFARETHSPAHGGHLNAPRFVRLLVCSLCGLCLLVAVLTLYLRSGRSTYPVGTTETPADNLVITALPVAPTDDPLQPPPAQKQPAKVLATPRKGPGDSEGPCDVHRCIKDSTGWHKKCERPKCKGCPQCKMIKRR